MLANPAPSELEIRLRIAVGSRICHQFVKQELPVESKRLSCFAQICFADFKRKLCKDMITGVDEGFLQRQLTMPGVLMIPKKDIFLAQCPRFVIRVHIVIHQRSAFLFKHKRPAAQKRAALHIRQISQRCNRRNDFKRRSRSIASHRCAVDHAALCKRVSSCGIVFHACRVESGARGAGKHFSCFVIHQQNRTVVSF